MTTEAFQARLASAALPHFFLARALAPLLKDDTGSSYTIISGTAGEFCWAPEVNG